MKALRLKLREIDVDKIIIDQNMLDRILDELQQIKRHVSITDERRVSIKEFAQRMKMTEVTFYDRIKKGEIEPPLKDGRYSYYLNSYVNKVVTKTINSDKVAANT